MNSSDASPDINTSSSIQEIRIDPMYTNYVVSKVNNLETGDTEPRIRNKTLLTRDFLHKLTKSMGNSQLLEVLPQNCRFVRRVRPYVILVVEDSPKIRTISVSISMDRDIERLKKTGKLVEYGFKNFLEKYTPPFKFTLSFPFIVYFVSFYSKGDKFIYDRFRVFYRLSPITSLSDYLLICNLPNIDSSFSACLGGDDQKYQKLAESFYTALERWWVNSFNVDYIDNYRKYDNVPEICNFLVWSYNTNRDPLFVFDIPWIKSNYTVGSLLESMEEHLSRNGEDGRNLTYNNIKEVFIRPQEEIPFTKDSPDLSNICDSIFLSNKELSVGEAVTIGKNNYYVYSFLGSRESLEATHISLEGERGNVKTVKLTKKLLDILNKQLDKTKFLESAELGNKEVIKVGDILVVDFPTKTYRTVEKIRVARDGLVEVKLFNDYYIARNLEAKVVDLENFVYNSTILKSGKEYLIIELKRTNLPASHYCNATFHQMSSSNGKLVMEFDYVPNLPNKKLRIDVENISWRIEPKSELTHIGNLFRVGRKLLTDSGKTIYFKGNTVMFNNLVSVKYDSEIVKQKIIKDNKLEIKSFDLDISFSINDKVVVADWIDPIQMLKVWTIVDFKVDSNNVKLCLKHKKEEKEVTYVDVVTGDVEVGLVRKVVNEFNGIKVGTKIRAKTTGTLCFPKKDVNMIVGFIVDTGGPPLVLCSNCCTLWFFELEENFDLILLNSKEWKELQHAPLKLSRLRTQPGDMFVTSDYSKKLHYYMYVLDRHGCYGYLPLRGYSVPSGVFFGFESSRSVISKTRYGFLTPRYTESQENNVQNWKSLLPNFHGLYTEEPRSPMFFQIDRRLIL